jgi:aminoglycoside phosphotransferase (APT) family kinase protein
MIDPAARPTEAFIDDIRRRFPVEQQIDACLTRKMRARPARSKRVQTVAEITARLQAFLRSRVDGVFSIDNVTALAGGTSKEQFAFDLVRDGGRRERLVIRIETPEAPQQTDRLREFQIIQALQGHVPIPRPLWLDIDGAAFDGPALIYTFSRGVNRPAREGATSGITRGFPPSYRRQLAHDFVDCLAAYTTAPITQEMTAFDVPRAGTNEGAVWGVNWWSRVFEEDALEPDPLMNAASRWLRDHAPIVDHISILHGDYRPGNFLFDEETGKITATLDWEAARLGDRHEDLAYPMNDLFAVRDERGRSLVCGLLTEDEYLARYAEKSGLPVDHERLRYYSIFNEFRATVFTHASAARCMLGGTSHQDLLVGLGTLYAPISRCALQRKLSEVM